MMDAKKVKDQARKYEKDVTKFLRDMIAIPSESCKEKEVIERIKKEMEKAGFDEIRIDGLGNILGRIGSGKHIIAMDAHIDTVGVGDPSGWKNDPYKGGLKDGIIYGRGASDQEGGMAAMVYAGKVIKDLKMEGDYTLWVTGTVMEEDCDGLCWQYILKEKVLEPKPEIVVITEPTNLNIYRGHRGRMEIEVETKGVSCHGSAPERGDNAVYKMAPIIAEIEKLNTKLRSDPFLGKGTVTISQIRSTSPSLCAVADSCTINLDRRLTKGETIDTALEEIRTMESFKRANAIVRVLEYAEKAYTGLVYPTKKYYPTWVLEEDQPGVKGAVAAFKAQFAKDPKVDKWTFSTNGIATMGMFGIPTIGFGPANEVYAHSINDQCPVEHLVACIEFYAAFPQHYLAALGKK